MQCSRWAALALCAAAPALAGAQELKPGTEYVIDPVRSEISWEVDSTLHAVRSRTRKIAGAVRVVDAGDHGVGLDGRLEIDAASFDTGNARRDRTLREETLNTAAHRRIVFSPRRIFRTSSWAEDEALTIEGDLAIRGVTKRVRIPVTLSHRGSRVVVEGATRLRWADYGVPDPSFFPLKVRPEVDVRAHLELLPPP
jgi:polyisoprenoid-binding protein YceI